MRIQTVESSTGRGTGGAWQAVVTTLLFRQRDSGSALACALGLRAWPVPSVIETAVRSHRHVGAHRLESPGFNIQRVAVHSPDVHKHPALHLSDLHEGLVIALRSADFASSLILADGALPNASFHGGMIRESLLAATNPTFRTSSAGQILTASRRANPSDALA